MATSKSSNELPVCPELPAAAYDSLARHSGHQLQPSERLSADGVTRLVLECLDCNEFGAWFCRES